MSTKAPIPPKYLKRNEGKWFEISTSDLTTLIHNVRVGESIEDVGFEDASTTMERLLYWLNKKVWVPPNVLESALWSANLLNERGEFWDSKGRDFNTFVRDICGKAKFNLFYNTIEREGK